MGKVSEFFQKMLGKPSENQPADPPRWEQYCDRGEHGEWIIGVRRVVRYRGFGEHELWRLRPGVSQIELRKKVREAQDRAALYNESWSNSH